MKEFLVTIATLLAGASVGYTLHGIQFEHETAYQLQQVERLRTKVDEITSVTDGNDLKWGECPRNSVCSYSITGSPNTRCWHDATELVLCTNDTPPVIPELNK